MLLGHICCGRICFASAQHADTYVPIHATAVSKHQEISIALSILQTHACVSSVAPAMIATVHAQNMVTFARPVISR